MRRYQRIKRLLFVGASVSLLDHNNCGVSGFAAVSQPKHSFHLFLRASNPPFHHASTRQAFSDTTSRPRSSTRLDMVFSANEAVLEQVSTEKIIDQILDSCLRTSARRPIMVQFNPASRAIWKHWKGTVFSETWKSVVQHILWSCLVYYVFWRYPAMKQMFAGYNILWGQLISVTTFTLTFFVNQSYSVWRTCLTNCRKLQGRLNDLVMALAGFAQRQDMTTEHSSGTGSSQFTESSRRILMVVARYIRLFNILSYASLTRSHRPLITPQGMRRMVYRGLMTPKERHVLLKAPVAATQRHNAVLMWILRTVIEGRKTGHIDGGFGFEQQIMSKIQEIRATANSMESVLRGRLPFSYAHINQVLIDTVLWMYPITAFCASMDLSFHLGMVGTVLLTMSYQGLFDLAKQFLDPFHNESHWSGEDALVVDTLIAETNAGSMRWMYSLDEMPISYDNFQQGQLDEFILPDEGYSREDADALREQREAKKRRERQQRKRDLAESRELNQTQEIIEKAAEELAVAQEEFEAAKWILNAPAASDFVPGIDDPDMEDGESKPTNKQKTKEDSGRGESLVVDSFMDAAAEEMGSKKETIFEETFDLGPQSTSDSTSGLQDELLEP